jgi:hypothetical protein
MFNFRDKNYVFYTSVMMIRHSKMITIWSHYDDADRLGLELGLGCGLALGLRLGLS